MVLLAEVAALEPREVMHLVIPLAREEQAALPLRERTAAAASEAARLPVQVAAESRLQAQLLATAAMVLVALPAAYSLGALERVVAAPMGQDLIPAAAVARAITLLVVQVEFLLAAEAVEMSDMLERVEAMAKS